MEHTTSPCDVVPLRIGIATAEWQTMSLGPPCAMHRENPR